MPWASAADDPLVPPPGSPLGYLFNKITQIAGRSWRSVLLIVFLASGLPTALIEFVYWVSYGYAGFGSRTPGRLDDVSDGRLLLGGVITFGVALALSFVVVAGWAAAVWALTVEASGERATLGAAFTFGFSRVLSLWVWALAVSLIVAVGTVCLVLPGIYLAVALSLFAMVVIYEPGLNPISRSFKLTHLSFGRTLGRVLLLGLVITVYSTVVNLIFSLIQSSIVSNTTDGLDLDAGSRVSLGVIGAIGDLISTVPGTALLAVALVPIYGELRARETPTSTPILRHQLGS